MKNSKTPARSPLVGALILTTENGSLESGIIDTMKSPTTDTIAAIATPAGEGAIAIIRVSGPDAITVGVRAFRSRTPLSIAQGYSVHYGTIVEVNGAEIDSGLVTVFRAPHSYTGEDSLEISCHGGIFVTNAVLSAVLSAGARLAEPGEFTRRAFLNGKIDLTQAEAVAGLIASTSGRAHRASLEQLRGRLGGTIEEIRADIIRLCALLEIDLDFSEEGLSIIGRESIERKIQGARNRIESMADTFKSGKLYRDGVSVVIAGKPNSGKSSLFNALLKESRAIVTAIPGTTRDYLEESIVIEGILFRLTDTAGLRESMDPIESEGIIRSRRSIERGDIVIIVDDDGDETAVDESIFGLVPLSDQQAVIVARNKIDLIPGRTPHKLSLGSNDRQRSQIWLSAKTGEGIWLLADELLRIVGESSISSHELVQITSKRHWESLQKTLQHLDAALHGLRKGITNEFLAFDVRSAAIALGEITGEVTSEEILNDIFSRFCIGK